MARPPEVPNGTAQDTDSVRVNFLLTVEAKHQLMHMAWTARKSMGALIRDLIRKEWLRTTS